MNTMTIASKKRGATPRRKGKMTTFTTSDREEAERFSPSNVPYDNGKIKMGIYYQRPNYVEYDNDMLLLQSHLIEDQRAIRLRNVSNVLYVLMLAFTMTVIWLSA
jgi:hypothetical protein